MRTIRIKLYKFSELGKEAKEKALENWRYNNEYFWADDAIKSLEKFAEHFDSKLKDYSIDWNNAHGCSVKFETPYSSDEIYEVGDFFGKNWLRDRIKAMGTYNKKTLRGDGECVFTGVCFDEDAADGARKAYYEGSRDLENILMAGYETWIKSCVSDYEYQQTEEFYADHADANNYEFTKDGKLA